MSNVTITQNYSGDGGGFYNAATTDAILVSISLNHAYANGGGIYNDAVLTLTDSSVRGNGAEGSGGMFDTAAVLALCPAPRSTITAESVAAPTADVPAPP